MSVNKLITKDDNTSKGAGISKQLKIGKPYKIGKPGPFQIIESEVQGSIDNPINAPRRRYECSNYETCLVIAAGLNWDSFTCRGCNGEFEESLHWRARQEINKDKTVKKICELPNACVNSESPNNKEANNQNSNVVSLRPAADESFKLKVVGKE